MNALGSLAALVVLIAGPGCGRALNSKIVVEPADLSVVVKGMGKQVDESVRLTNRGTAPVTCTVGPANCGCLMLTPPRVTLLPGQSVPIQIRIDSKVAGVQTYVFPVRGGGGEVLAEGRVRLNVSGGLLSKPRGRASVYVTALSSGCAFIIEWHRSGGGEGDQPDVRSTGGVIAATLKEQSTVAGTNGNVVTAYEIWVSLCDGAQKMGRDELIVTTPDGSEIRLACAVTVSK
ncbi:MAG: DUF1573 domain-containing protein [Planctomycetes bacterium]|nr:DUF1573 domain-containing protein [Planctomycetota bacterium]